ncbi:hypothetical protein ACWEKM_31415 [Streptomyces sp. NPDC004752]
MCRLPWGDAVGRVRFRSTASTARQYRMVHVDLAGHRARMQVPADVRLSGEIPVHSSREDVHYFTGDGQRCP